MGTTGWPSPSTPRSTRRAVEERGIERTPGLAAAPTDAGDAAIVSAWKVRNAGMETAWPKRNPGAGGCRGRG